MEGPPAYTTLEVAKHCTAEDAWLIIGGNVLNVSTWLNDHPGGDDVLLDLAGRDATREFEDVGHSSEARARLENLVIGTVRPATDEELRISCGEDGSGGKITMRGSERAEAAITWMRDNVLTLKRVGAVGAAGAIVLGVAIWLQRYSTKSYAGRR